MRKRTFLASTVILVLALIGFSTSPPNSGPDAQPSASRPKLLLVLVIDQFRYDYLERFQPEFVARGFNLLLSGANFVDCRYDYATTVTSAGHATLFTGAYPNLHGIIGNEWYDRNLRRQVSSVEDSDTELVRGAEPSVASGASTTPRESGVSPRNLKLNTLGDELRIASNFRSKVVALSLKDRSAVLPGGHTANAAYWYDAKTGRFLSSSYYMQVLPPWVAQFNDRSPAKAYCSRPWRALPETPQAWGRILSEYKPAPNEPCPSQKFMQWLETTPSMNEIELDFARQAVRNERLGQGTDTDLLAISLSVNDHIGHAYGPYSPEVADVTLRTDRNLAAFFADLDRFIGLKNVWIALSADHGVAPNPGSIKEHRLGVGHAQVAGIRAAIEQGLTQAFGQDQWIEAVAEFNVYLNPEAAKKRQLDPAKVEAVAAEAATAALGVRAAYSRTQLLYGILNSSPLSRKASNSFLGTRSGDIFLVLEPYAVPVQGDTGSTHGSPWSYDAQVPLVLWGEAFKPGRYAETCQPIDLAPTLAVALGLSQPSGAQGGPLISALK